MSKYNKEELWDKLFMIIPNVYFVEQWGDEFVYEHLEDTELFIYALVASEQYSLFAKGYYSINRIVKLMNMYVNTDNKKQVRKALRTLVERKEIILYSNSDEEEKVNLDELKPADFFYASLNVDIPYDVFYTKVFYDEFCAILKIKDVNTVKLFNVYLHIVSRMFEGETGDKVFFANVLDLVDETGYDRKTIMKYVRILCEEDILIGVTVHTNKSSKNFLSRKRNEGAIQRILKEKYGPESNTKHHVTGIEYIGKERKELC